MGTIILLLKLILNCNIFLFSFPNFQLLRSRTKYLDFSIPERLSKLKLARYKQNILISCIMKKRIKRVYTLLIFNLLGPKISGADCLHLFRFTLFERKIKLNNNSKVFTTQMRWFGKYCFTLSSKGSCFIFLDVNLSFMTQRLLILYKNV